MSSEYYSTLYDAHDEPQSDYQPHMNPSDSNRFSTTGIAGNDMPQSNGGAAVIGSRRKSGGGDGGIVPQDKTLFILWIINMMSHLINIAFNVFLVLWNITQAIVMFALWQAGAGFISLFMNIFPMIMISVGVIGMVSIFVKHRQIALAVRLSRCFLTFLFGGWSLTRSRTRINRPFMDTSSLVFLKHSHTWSCSLLITVTGLGSLAQ